MRHCGLNPIQSKSNPFQSTHPLRGATNRTRRTCWRTWDFNPRTPCGVRPGSGRAPRHADAISIHAPLAGCDYDLPRQFRIIGISIHAPLAGCDCPSTKSTRGFAHFNPRTPCGVRLFVRLSLEEELAFQSTHPLRGATLRRYGQLKCMQISIHAPLAGCDAKLRRLLQRCEISIHAPLAGCDTTCVVS